MDPLSQGSLGAALPQAFSNKKEMRWASIVGLFSGMSPDLDVFIRSEQDPLLYFEYHRHFTHSLFFIPIGAFICATLFYFLFRKKKPFGRIYFYSFLGYATHALLDCCTQYGTKYFWPFSDLRVAWNSISIIDPLWTVPVLILVILSFALKKTIFSRVALLWAFLYLSFGLYQNSRATKALYAWVASQGQVVERANVSPSFGNLLVWKGLYEFEGEYHVVGMRMGVQAVRYFPGDRLKKFNVSEVDLAKVSADDLARFQHFTMDFLAWHPSLPNTVVDARYSILPNSTQPLWGLSLEDTTSAGHLHVLHFARDGKAAWKELRAMLFEDFEGVSLSP